MSATIRRKLAALERAVTPEPAQSMLVLAEPGPEATDEDRRRYQEQIAAGRAAGSLVILICPLGPRRREHEGRGCKIVGSEAEAAMLIAANQRGEEPGQSRLREILDQRAGVILTPELVKQLYPEKWCRR